MARLVTILSTVVLIASLRVSCEPDDVKFSLPTGGTWHVGDSLLFEWRNAAVGNVGIVVRPVANTPIARVVPPMVVTTGTKGRFVEGDPPCDRGPADEPCARFTWVVDDKDPVTQTKSLETGLYEAVLVLEHGHVATSKSFTIVV
ncbi:uncharacterized protein UTRI_10123 [Ustilago trichophora]|uniref:Uncharacterized protein n=1 Tax=Ustilago trichophora TaxID=86804 RepID=A0A5C3DZX7_9BASI|nr:uncharacterized protein UTRI_10123 [Ustilago trichophora]